MKHLQTKYNLLHLFFWTAFAYTNGYMTIYLQTKGLSNTQVGIVTGGCCILSVLASPVISSLLQQIRWLTVRTLIALLELSILFGYAAVTYLPLPVPVIIIIYTALACLGVSCNPLLSSISMQYNKMGHSVNFGIARGLGSAGYAVMILVIAQILNHTSLNIMPVLFTVFLVPLLFVLRSLPDFHYEAVPKGEGSLFYIIRKYHILFIILLGFALDFAGACTTSTYLIDIVRDLGGTTTAYSVAVFFMAFGELPAMAAAPVLMKKMNLFSIVLMSGFFYLFRNLLVAFAPVLPLVFLGMMFQSVTYGFLYAAIVYYAGTVCEKRDEILGQTLITVMTSGFGSMTGNLLGGFLQDHFGMSAMKAFVLAVTLLGSLILTGVGLHYRRAEAAAD